MRSAGKGLGFDIAADLARIGRGACSQYNRANADLS